MKIGVSGKMEMGEEGLLCFYRNPYTCYFFKLCVYITLFIKEDYKLPDGRDQESYYCKIPSFLHRVGAQRVFVI